MSECCDENKKEYRGALDRAEIVMREKINKAIRDFFDEERAIFRAYEAKFSDEKTSDENIPDKNTPRGTKVYVRNCDDEPWEEAYFCTMFLRGRTYPFAVYCDENYDLCECEFANGVRFFKLCIVAEE